MIVKYMLTIIIFLITYCFTFIGSKRTFLVSFTRGKCIATRYQPFRFQSNESMSDCIYAKSLCKEEGQIVYKDKSLKK